MKKVQKGAEPDKLMQYRQLRPANTWKQCAKDKDRKVQIQNQLKLDQGGLCAYCEIDLKPADGNDAADLRVEHFHPKTDASTQHNWHLDWQNLLACCHGGSRSDVVDSGSRHTSPDHSCDVPKANNDWDDIILNPLHLPASLCLFKFNRADGSISVNIAHCQQAGVDESKAQATIDMLRLDSTRLRNLRERVLNNLNEQLRNMMLTGYTAEEARMRLTKTELKKDDHGNWPAFFSAIRSYLGSAAEQQLNTINYKG
ncbi:MULTISPECIES: retron Ec78 anti-phage system effector HNH endonuclease PtuB [Methylobacter]